jgi:hypothetical protein
MFSANAKKDFGSGRHVVLVFQALASMWAVSRRAALPSFTVISGM